jgi:formylglycine-generating enzyme required for sulfatase activity
LLLADRASLYNARPEVRHLPWLGQWLRIRCLTHKKNWTPPQRTMMRKADCFHAVLAVVLLLVTGIGWGIWSFVDDRNNASRAHGLVDQVLVAETVKVPRIIDKMKDYRRWTDPLLRDAYTEAEKTREARRQLHASLALLPVDPAQVAYLYERLLDASPEEVGVIVEALSDTGHGQELTERLWGVVEDPPKGREAQRLRAACALASYAPEDLRWDRTKGPVVEQLVGVDLVYLKTWLDALRPVSGKLLEPLKTVFRDRTKERAAQRSVAASILADYAADDADVLADLVQDADEKQFGVLFPKLEARREAAVAAMSSTVGMSLESQKTENEKEELAKRQANAAVTLLRLGEAGKVWPLLKHPSNPQAKVFGFSDPRARSYLIHRLSPLGADPQAVIKQLDVEKDVSIRRALLLILGEFRPDQLLPADRKLLISKVQELYGDDSDPGLHGAAEWLLRVWGLENKIKEVERTWINDPKKRAEKEEEIRKELANHQTGGKAFWYVNGQGHTMVVISGPVTFKMGSPPTEDGRETGGSDTEKQHPTKIRSSFAIATKEVTVEQMSEDFMKFYEKTGRRNWKDISYHAGFARTRDCPVNQMMWYDAAAYCNWLSEKEGLHPKEWCYKLNNQGKFDEGMKLADNYQELKGYRLPSEAEWEYACRAGAMTSRYYGETEDLLGEYACYAKNSKDQLQVPGKLKPNDLGLFDMLGNAVEWCQNPIGLNNKYVDDGEFEREIKDAQIRLLRGGSFPYAAPYARSACRGRNSPIYHDTFTGFRVARTFP